MNAVIPIQPAHAKLSASGSKKWLTCTRSASLEEQFPDEGSEYAAEGTFAHEVFELAMLTALELVPFEDAQKQLWDLRRNPLWSQDLEDHVRDASERARAAIGEASKRCADPVFMVERRLDYSPWVPEGFGTGDLVIVTDDVVEVMDLKFGKGLLVEAPGNSQMQLYGLGAYNELAHLYDIRRVRMTILQPRLNNYSTSEMPIEDLLEWAENFVKPRARLAWDGAGAFVPGDHCTSGFCRARYQCPARAEAALEVARQDFALKPPELLTTDQLVDVLAKADMAIDWLNDVKAFALKQAEAGHEIPGFKLVEGRSNRKYTDPDTVAKVLTSAGVEEALIYERSLRGITAMEKILGKKKFADLLSDHVAKPAGKPVLVPVDDKRPAISSVASAAVDFSEPAQQ